MKSLLLKDLYNVGHNAKSMLFVLACLAVAIVPTSGPVAYTAMCGVMSAMMIVTTFSFDDAVGWTQYALILPLRRRDVVAAKYAALAVFCTAGTLFGLAASSLGAAVAGAFRPMAFGPLEMLAGALVGWAAAYAMGSTAIPLVYRYGTERARILIVVAFVIPAAVVIGLAGALSMAGVTLSEGQVIALLCASPLAALAWGAVMYRVACGVFAKKDY